MKQDNSKKEQVDIFNSDLCLNLVRAIGSDEMDIQEKSVIIKKAFTNDEFQKSVQKSVKYAFSRKHPALYQKQLADGGLNPLGDAYEYMMMLSQRDPKISTPSAEILQNARTGDIEAQQSVKYWFWARMQDIAAKSISESRFLEAPVTLTRDEVVEYRKYRNRKFRTHLPGDEKKALAVFLDYSHIYVHLYAEGLKNGVFNTTQPAFASLQSFTKTLFEHARERVLKHGVEEFTFDSAIHGFLRQHCDSYALSQLKPIADLDRIHLNVPAYKSGLVLSLDVDTDDEAQSGSRILAESAIATNHSNKKSQQEHHLSETIASIMASPAPVRLQVLEALYLGKRHGLVAENHLKVIHSLVKDQNTLKTPVKALSENTALDPKTISKITADLLSKSDAFLASKISVPSISSIADALKSIDQHIQIKLNKEKPVIRKLRQQQVTAIPIKTSEDTNKRKSSLRVI